MGRGIVQMRMDWHGLMIDLHPPEALQRRAGGLDPKLYGNYAPTRLRRAIRIVGDRLLYIIIIQGNGIELYYPVIIDFPFSIGWDLNRFFPVRVHSAWGVL